ncbi:MAG: hypothetical protein ACPGXY_01735 [Alphaproteobacteria bacterium]
MIKNLSIFLLTLSTFYTSTQTIASNSNSEAENATPKHTLQLEGDGHVGAAARFELLKTVLTENPDMNYSTRVASENTLWPLYEADRDFILKATSGRANSGQIKSLLVHIDTVVKSENFHEMMSLLDLNLIGRIWVYVLSTTKESQKYIQIDMHGENVLGFDRMKIVRKVSNTKKITKILEHRSKSFLKMCTPNMPKQYYIPLVSPTGSFPLPLMRSAWVFQHPGQETLTSLDFLAVATNVVADFDYVREMPPCDLWEHDAIHVRKCRPTTTYNNPEYNASIAVLNQSFEASQPSIEQNGLFNLAFFLVFHEPRSPTFDAEEKAEMLLYLATKKLKSESIQFTYSGFQSKEQAESLINTAESVGLKCPGKTLEEQYRAYLRHAQNSLELLRKFAQE